MCVDSAMYHEYRVLNIFHLMIRERFTLVIHVSTLITTIFVSKTNCNQFQRITSFLHLHRQNPAQSCLRMSRHGAQDVMARSRVTCHVSHADQCDVRGAGGAGGGGGLRHLPSSIASPPPAGNCSVLTSAVKRSISFTIGFHNHGEGPY